MSNSVPPTYPDGLDVEIFNRESLILADAECADPFQREHVTPWMRTSGCCRLGHKQHQFDCSSMRWTVDEPEDLQVIRSVVDYYEGCSDFAWEQVLELAQQQPHLFSLNARFARNEGATMGEGQKLGVVQGV